MLARRQRVGDARQQARPVAGHDLENVVRALVVGKDLHFRRQREVLQLAADAARWRTAAAARAFVEQPA